VNQAIAEMLKRLDPAMKRRMNKVKALRALLGLSANNTPLSLFFRSEASNK
jgi:hypothetical protein